MKLVLDGIRIVIDAIVAGLKFIGIGGGNTAAKNLETAAANAGYGGGSYINPMNAGGGTNTTLTTSTNLYLDGRIVAQSVNKYLGPTLRAGGPNRTGGR